MKKIAGVVAGVSLLAVGVAGTGESAARAHGLVWGPCEDAGAASETASGATEGAVERAATHAVRGADRVESAMAGALARIGTALGHASGAEARPASRPAGDGGVGRVECATLRVPLDHDVPSGQAITLALNRIRGSVSRDHNHLGVLLVNPGGPGASGRSLAEHVAATLPGDVAARFDVIGFDPRGVGASRPAVSCVDAERHYAAPRPDNVPRDRAEEDALRERARQYALACGNRWSWFLPYLTTQDSARDMEAIRQALGEDKISYIGYSYGTYLGAVYATRYPDRVRRLVFDSVVDPGAVWYAANINQNHAFERRHRDFLAWTARHHRVYRLGSDAEKVRFAWQAMRDRLRIRPAGGLVGPSELDDVFTVGGYSDRLWPELAQAFSGYVRSGETDGLVAAHRHYARHDAAAENGYAVYLGVECRDALWPRDWARWRADMTRGHRLAPFLTWPNAWYNAPCAFWPEPGGAPPAVRGTAKLPPILLVQSQRDAATPYGGAVQVRRLFPTARLLAETGGNHGVALAGNACVDRALAAYLREGIVPGGATARTGAVPDASCAAGPAPRPVTLMAAGPRHAHLRLTELIRGTGR